MTYYASFAPQQAADRLDARVTRLQRQSEKLARAAFDRVRPTKQNASKGKTGAATRRDGGTARKQP